MVSSAGAIRQTCLMRKQRHANSKSDGREPTFPIETVGRSNHGGGSVPVAGFSTRIGLAPMVTDAPTAIGVVFPARSRTCVKATPGVLVAVSRRFHTALRR